MKRILLATVLSAAVPAMAEEPSPGLRYALPGGDRVWTVSKDGQLDVVSANGVVTATFDLGGCRFCSGGEDNCDQDGVFPVVMPGEWPSVALGVACHVGAHSQRFAVYDPAGRRSEPVFSVSGRYWVRVAPLATGGVVVGYDDGTAEAPRQRTAVWPEGAGDGPAVAVEKSRKAVRILPPAAPQLSGDAQTLVSSLRRIVGDRDAKALVAMLSPDVLASFGGDGGVAEFRAKWRLDGEGGASGVWTVLDRLLRHPPHVARLDDEGVEAVFPYYFSAWPEGDDSFDAFFADGRDVPLRAGPSPSAPVVGHLAFEAVFGQPDTAFERVAGDDGGWAAVRTATGAFGYVDTAQVPPVLSYRAVFERRAGRWQLAALVDGD